MADAAAFELGKECCLFTVAVRLRSQLYEGQGRSQFCDFIVLLLRRFELHSDF